jgi:hypothetical protein
MTVPYRLVNESLTCRVEVESPIPELKLLRSAILQNPEAPSDVGKGPAKRSRYSRPVELELDRKMPRPSIPRARNSSTVEVIADRF